jgi:hypothetical protein
MRKALGLLFFAAVVAVTVVPGAARALPGERPGQIEIDVWHPRAEELGLEQAFFRLQLAPGSGPPLREGPLAPLSRLGEDGEPSPLSLPLVASPVAVEHASRTKLVPEPASGWLVAAGATALALLRRRRARR